MVRQYKIKYNDESPNNEFLIEVDIAKLDPCEWIIPISERIALRSLPFMPTQDSHVRFKFYRQGEEAQKSFYLLADSRGNLRLRDVPKGMNVTLEEVAAE